ncbi:SPX-domain-containing protein [Martensiomyces pterosporus]|nr:SPX-domain-containing protein [Martensiomyces pterosporus]
MKFGQQLRESLFPDWKFYYVDYSNLKRFLYERADKGYTADDEAEFVNLLEGELEKVNNFQQTKSGEMKRRIEYCEQQVNLITENNAPTEAKREQLDIIEKEIDAVISEVYELAKFTRLNFTAFIKIVKKHDKNAPFVLKPVFTVRLNQKPFFKENFDELLLELSRLYNIVRNGGVDVDQGKDPQSGNGQNFVRQTTKYWVHPDNVMELKLYILKYLPVLIYRTKGASKPPNPAITSIYFDNEGVDLYQGRIEKSEGAEAIRLRWYGDMESNEIFIERKTHHEDWTGEKSVKERFSLKEKYVNDYLAGRYTLDAKIRKLREEGKKSDQDLQDMETLAYEVQASVEKKHLVPVVRTFYNRTAFQLPGDARVRISLDTELTMVREDGFDGKSRAGDNWRRTDIGVDYPFSQLPEKDVCRFPYAILEVKLQTQSGVEPPQWVDDLINSHLVEAVPKFSKFIHGVSTLLEDRVDVFPFWFSQMDRDIRKPVIKDIGVSRASSPRGSMVDIDNLVRHRGSSSRSNNSSQYQPDIEVIVEEEPGENSSQNDGSQSRYTNSYDDDADRTVNEESALLGGSSRSRGRRRSAASGLPWLLQQINPFSSSSHSSRGEPTRDAPFIAQQSAGGSNQKRIAVPVRVEPKVFFANERTFLAWLNFSIVLGSLALGLLNFGDQTGRIAGAVFTLIAMFVMVYALLLFQWRAERIRQRDSGPYDDRKGPTILVIILIAAVVLNFYLKVKSGL